MVQWNFFFKQQRHRQNRQNNHSYQPLSRSQYLNPDNRTEKWPWSCNSLIRIYCYKAVVTLAFGILGAIVCLLLL